MVLMPGFQSTRLVTEGALEPFFFLYTDDSIQGNTETCKQSSIMLNYEVKNTFAVGRKNWLFSNSVDRANASAVVYTMVEMAKAYDLNIYGYLKFLLEHRPSKDMTDEQLAELAPWSEKLQSIKNRM